MRDKPPSVETASGSPTAGNDESDGVPERIVNDLEQALAGITPRAATVTLLLFEKIVDRYERDYGRKIGVAEEAMIVAILRQVVARDSQPADIGRRDST